MTEPTYTEDDLAAAEAEMAAAEAGEDAPVEDDPNVVDEAPTEEPE